MDLRRHADMSKPGEKPRVRKKSEEPAPKVQPPPTDIDYRERARARLADARELLAKGDDKSLEYACLELRKAIEALAYARVKMYRRDLSDETLEEWNAVELLKRLAKLDPASDGDRKMEIPDAAGDYANGIVLNDFRLTYRWASKNYRALGNFLHERKLVDLERSGDFHPAKARRTANRVVVEIERVLSSNAPDLQITRPFAVYCECGSLMQFQATPDQVTSRVPCLGCRKFYEITLALNANGKHNVIELR
jgi:hypothetical protein